MCVLLQINKGDIRSPIPAVTKLVSGSLRQAGGYLDIRLPFGFAPECGAGSLEAPFFAQNSSDLLCFC